MLHPFRIPQSFRASFTAQCFQMYQIIWLVKMSFVAMVGVEAVLALAEVEEAAAVVAKNVARQTAKRRPAARGTALIEAPAVAMPSTRAGPLSRSCVRLPSSSSKTEAKLVGYKSGAPTPGELTKPQAAAPKRSITGAPDTTAKNRRPSKPATEGSAPPLKTRRIWLLLLLATGQALAASPTTIGDPKFGPLPLSRVPPTLITAGATDCPPWCLSRAMRSWACETLDCRPCLSACLVVEYRSSGGQPAAGGRKDPAHSTQISQQQQLAQDDGSAVSPQLRSVLPAAKGDQEAAAVRERLTSQQQSWTCSPTWPPQHLYVIFSLPRSASTTVCNVINTLGNAYCGHELLNQGLISRADERALLKSDPARLMQHRFEAAFADMRAAP